MKRFLWLIVGLLGFGGYLRAAQAVDLKVLERDLFQAKGLASFNSYDWILQNDLSEKLDLINQRQSDVGDLLGFGDEFSAPVSPPASTGASSLADLEGLFDSNHLAPAPRISERISDPEFAALFDRLAPVGGIDDVSVASTQSINSRDGDFDDFDETAGSDLGDDEDNDPEVLRRLAEWDIEVPEAEPSNFEEMLPLMVKVRAHDVVAIKEASDGLSKEIDPDNVAYVEFLLNELDAASYVDLIGEKWVDKQAQFSRPDLISQHGIAEAIARGEAIPISQLDRLLGTREGRQAVAGNILGEIVPRQRPETADFFAGIPQNEVAEAAVFDAPAPYRDPFAAAGGDAGEYANLFGDGEYLPAFPVSGDDEALA